MRRSSSSIGRRHSRRRLSILKLASSGRSANQQRNPPHRRAQSANVSLRNGKVKPLATSSNEDRSPNIRSVSFQKASPASRIDCRCHQGEYWEICKVDDEPPTNQEKRMKKTSLLRSCIVLQAKGDGIYDTVSSKEPSDTPTKRSTKPTKKDARHLPARLDDQSEGSMFGRGEKSVAHPTVLSRKQHRRSDQESRDDGQAQFSSRQLKKMDGVVEGTTIEHHSPVRADGKARSHRSMKTVQSFSRPRLRTNSYCEAQRSDGQTLLPKNSETRADMHGLYDLSPNAICTGVMNRLYSTIESLDLSANQQAPTRWHLAYLIGDQHQVLDLHQDGQNRLVFVRSQRSTLLDGRPAHTIINVHQRERRRQ